MQTILRYKARRRRFLIVISLIFAVLLVIRLYVIAKHCPPSLTDMGYVCQIFEDIVDALFVSLLVTVFIGLFIFYIEIPESEKKHEIIEPNRISEALIRGRSETDFWYFSGGTGSFTRAETLPALNTISKGKNEHRMVKIILLDPMDEDLCCLYAIYRQNLKSSNKQWTSEYVRMQIVSTICAAIIYRNLNPMLEINIYLKKSFSTLRIDLNQSSCIITKEDKYEPAILIPVDTFLYRTYKEEVLHVSKQCSEIDMRCDIPEVSLESLSTINIKKICQHLKFDAVLSDEDYSSIATILKKNENPYKRMPF